ncbi:hypothetical protein PR048_002061 [Dryococelus australis]|uniref:Uncharacterized protein n=1 Tax=Dryococelus australis TaxID=614101 RepID=A0ABQ9IJ76_9NEOP|nr:hypothetical protein PR048_002061 [Dryococelus australis]
MGYLASHRSLGKAVYRVKKFCHKKNKAAWNKIPDKMISKVENFYCRDNRSQQAPGKKHYKCVKDKTTGVMNKIQKLCMMTIKEAYSLFTSENTDISIKPAKFYELRPQFILPSFFRNAIQCMLVLSSFIVEVIVKAVSAWFSTEHQQTLRKGVLQNHG